MGKNTSLEDPRRRPVHKKFLSSIQNWVQNCIQNFASRYSQKDTNQGLYTKYSKYILRTTTTRCIKLFGQLLIKLNLNFWHVLGKNSPTFLFCKKNEHEKQNVFKSFWSLKKYSPFILFFLLLFKGYYLLYHNFLYI